MSTKIITNNNAIVVNPDGSINFKMPITTIGNKKAITSKSTSYTASFIDEIIVFTSNATLTLPATTGSGTTYRIICRAGMLQILPTGTDTINGMASQTLDAGENIILSDTETGYWE